MNNHIQVGEAQFGLADGTPFQFQSKYSDRALAGIELEFVAAGSGTFQMLEDMFQADAVPVDDPFANRSYQAKVRLVSSSYQQGSPTKSYVIEVREMDEAPQFSFITVAGERYPVLTTKGKPSRSESGDVTFSLLLQLSTEQFRTLRRELRSSESPLLAATSTGEERTLHGSVRPGYWSRHEEAGSTFYKQILFVVPDISEPKADGLVPLSHHQALADTVVDLLGRFRALVNTLVAMNILPTDKAEALLRGAVGDLLDDEQLDIVVRAPFRVNDAQDHFA